MIKNFKTLSVLGAYSGFVLDPGGFSGIHEVLNHFYPGIMTIGCAVMSETAAREIERQHPELADLGECTKENYQQYADAGIARFGNTIALVGPHGTGNPDMEGK